MPKLHRIDDAGSSKGLPKSDYDLFVDVYIDKGEQPPLAVNGFRGLTGVFSPEAYKAAMRMQRRDHAAYFTKGTLASLSIYTALFALAALQLQAMRAGEKAAGLNVGQWSAVGLMAGLCAYPLASLIASRLQPYHDYEHRKLPELGLTMGLSVVLSPLMTLIMAQPQASGYAVLQGLLANTNPVLLTVCLYGLAQCIKGVRRCRQKPLDIGFEVNYLDAALFSVDGQPAQPAASGLEHHV